MQERKHLNSGRRGNPRNYILYEGLHLHVKLLCVIEVWPSIVLKNQQTSPTKGQTKIKK